MNDWPTGIGLRTLDIVDSTNAEGRRLAYELEQPTWIMAKMQTAGRGRLGREWSSATGNLMASLVFQILDNRAAALRSYVSALALHDVCVEFTGRNSQFSLKWPNDLLLNRGKLAGILLECAASNGGFRLIIGFGVNLALVPKAVRFSKAVHKPVSLLQETGVSVNPVDFLTRLAHRFQYRESQFCEEGFESIRKDWTCVAAGLGEQVRFQGNDRPVSGRFAGIDENGSAVLISDDRRFCFSAGDMMFEDGGSSASSH